MDWHNVRCCVCGRLLFRTRGQHGSDEQEIKCRGCASVVLITRGVVVTVVVAGHR